MTFASGYIKIPLTGAALFAGGEIGSRLNPEGVPLIITDVKLYVATPSAGVCNMNCGIAATAATSDTDMINALAINGALTGLAYHGMAALAAKGAAQVWAPGEFITATGSASSAGFTGTLFVQYIRATG